MFYVVWAALFLIALSAGYAGISAAPWVPTKRKQVELFLEQVTLHKGTHVVDLGCGTGTLLFAAARQEPEIIATGYEISILPFLIAIGRKMLSPKRYKNVSIRFKNLFYANLAEADVLFIFLLSKAYPKVLKKLAHNIKPDSTIVVEAWPLLPVPNGKKVLEEGLLPVYVYRGAELLQD